MLESVPYHQPGTIGVAGFNLACLATSTIEAGTYVDVTATRDVATSLVKVGTATAAGRSFGIAAGPAAPGQQVRVIRMPRTIAPVVAGASITAGAEVQVGANGAAVPLSAGVPVGRAVETGTSGQPVLVELY